MALKANRKYTGTVVSGALMQSNAKKTPGFQIFIETEDGEIDHTIWLTHKNKDRASQDFETLGVSLDRLKEAGFVQNQLGAAVVGREVEFETKEESYRDEIKVKVSWIAPVGAEDEKELSYSVVNLFGGSVPPLKPKPAPTPMDDDPIPF